MHEIHYIENSSRELIRDASANNLAQFNNSVDQNNEYGQNEEIDTFIHVEEMDKFKHIKGSAKKKKNIKANFASFMDEIPDSQNK